tara:strand:+ start:1925 stop:3289 length:1365 start_codon:yes stop_codon:yes gene_type:complete
VIKRILAALAVTSIAALAGLWWLAGIGPTQLSAALALGTGVGAKLACSGRYLSGFDQQRIEDDVASYSALTRSIRYRSLPDGGVSASLLGRQAVARYRPGLGCALEYGANSVLDQVEVPTSPSRNASTAPWPQGESAGPPDAAMQRLLEEMLAADNAAGLDTRALLVVHRGRILGEAYAEGIDIHTPLLGWSMGKSVTAIMLGRLERLGLLETAERGLFPAWADDTRAQISVENMLHMTSGLSFTEDYVPGTDSTRMLFESPSAASVAMASPALHPPGTHFYYSSGTTNLLSLLVFERVGGSAQAQIDFFQQEIALPLGLRNTIPEPDASGVFVGSSFVYAPARDWARFGQLLLAGGQINGRRVLSADWVKRATQPNRSENDRRYGYQLWLNEGGSKPWWPSLPRSAYAMQGNRSQSVMILPEQDTVIVRLGWTATEYPADANFARIVAALGKP